MNTQDIVETWRQEGIQDGVKQGIARTCGRSSVRRCRCPPCPCALDSLHWTCCRTERSRAKGRPTSSRAASEMALRREVVLHFRPSSEHPIAPRA